MTPDIGQRPRASVVIPNYNGLGLIGDCLGSVRAQAFRDREIIVADNGSTDDSVAWLRTNAPDVRLVTRMPNAGFGAAVNDGIRAARGEYVVVLVNDTVVEPGWLEALVAALDRTGYDFGASMLVFAADPETVNAAGDMYALGRLSGVQRGRGRGADGYRETVRVLGASAGSAIYRRDFFEDVGLFDEDFYLLHEDTDLNLRALIAGKRGVYVPDSVVRHREHATIDREPSDLIKRIGFRNQFMVVGKDFPAVLLAALVVLWPWVLFRQTIPLRPSKWRHLPRLLAALPGTVAAEVEGFRMGMRKRRDVWRRQAVGARRIVRWILRGAGPIERR
jgi:GT2 family glycosyltransferase